MSKSFVGVNLLDNHHLIEMSDWCNANTGAWSWNIGMDTSVEFKFDHEQDAVFFALRWKS